MALFVAIDGVDSAGKATQSQILAATLTAKLFSFPRYETTVGKIIKRHLKNEVMLTEAYAIDGVFSGNTRRASEDDPIAFQALNLADKAEADADIKRTLAAGINVVCDRWIPSALCYGAADGIDQEWLRAIHESFTKANLNIFLDVPPEEALRRRPEARDRYERDREKQKRVREEYQKLWAQGGARYVTIDGTGSKLDVADWILAAVRSWL